VAEGWLASVIVSRIKCVIECLIYEVLFLILQLTVHLFIGGTELQDFCLSVAWNHDPPSS
jgi:hypothetical protein